MTFRFSPTSEPGTPLSSLAAYSVLLLLTVLISAFGTGRASADWINLTGAETSPNIAEIIVREDRVHVVLQLFVDDLESMDELLSDDALREKGVEPPPMDERMERFSQEKFQVIVDGTTNLTAQLRFSEPRLRKDRSSPVSGIVHPLTRQSAPEPPDDKRILHAELDYFFDRKPKTLTFIPPLDENGRASLDMGFIVYHESVPVIDFRYLTGPVKLNLNWEDPWFSAFDNPNLKRHHRWPIMSFLYVEPREVRHEVVVRLRDLEDWTDLKVARKTPITVEKRSGILNAVNRFFAEKNPVIIDGSPASATSVGSDFLDLSLTGIQVIDDDRNLDPATAVLGVTLSYPVERMPEEVTTIWELFSDRIERVPVTSIDPVGPFPSEVGITEPAHSWTNHLLRYEDPRVEAVPVSDERALKLPLLTIVLAVFALNAVAFAIKARRWARAIGVATAIILVAGAASTTKWAIATLPNPFASLPGNMEASNAVQAVFENASAAFYEVDDNRLETELSKFVDPGLAPIVSTELERANRIALEGGTTARAGNIGEVTISEIRPLDAGRGFSAVAEWSAEAIGQHWGRLHLRDVNYRARIDMIEDDRVWRLAGLTDLDMKIEQ
ncbi:MAG: hypothetical protein RIE06_12840 [Roseibium album]|uniref:hypothetical protein n=1 Tax=Roseibium album TaxID=311410 RepID=UPI0032EF9046